MAAGVTSRRANGRGPSPDGRGAGRGAADPAQRALRLRERLELVPAWRGLSGVRESFTEPLRVLMITTALVLIIGCANLASLVLARGSARAREFLFGWRSARVEDESFVSS